MRKSLIAQSAAVMIAGLAISTGASAVVSGIPAGADLTRPAVGTIADAAPNVVAAEQLVVNTDGIGHINLIPYYTVQSGYDTYINIVNTDTRAGKAVKVRFRGASNSDDVFDFTLLLSPGDKFAFAVTKDAATGLPKIAMAGGENADTSCTLGDGVNNINGKTFITARLNPKLTGDALANEAREGYVEILNMADIPPNAVAGSLFQTIKHKKQADNSWKATCDLTVLSTALGTNPSSYADAQARGLEVPTTGLVTNWTLINVNKAAAYTGAATAVEARTLATGPAIPGVAGYGNIVLFAQNNTAITTTALTADAIRIYTADPLLRSWTGATIPTTPANYDLPDLSTPYLNAALDATGVLPGGAAANDLLPLSYANELSRSLAVTSVSNEFNTFDGLAASTDWIFSLPTRRYNIAVDYGTAPAYTATAVSSDYAAAGVPDLYVGQAHQNYFVRNTAVGAAAVNGNVIFNPDDTAKSYQLCVTGISFANAWTHATRDSLTKSPNTSGATLDHEERNLTVDDPTNPFVISPSIPGVQPTLAFCGEVAVFKFGRASGDASVLGADVAAKGLQDIEFVTGWTRLATPGLAAVAAPPAGSANGLPIIGSAVTELNNSGVGAVGAGYGQTFPHRMTRP